MAVEKLNKPYPLISELRGQLITSLSFGLFIFLFLLFFQPFGLRDMDASKSLYVLGFGFITFLAMILNFRLGHLIFPNFFNDDTWTIKREITYGLWNILVITLLNYIYNAFVTGKAIHPSSIFIFGIITLSVGIFPLTIMVFVRELFLTDRREKAASLLSRRIQDEIQDPKQHSSSKLIIRGNSSNESVELNDENLLFVQSSDNYCQVHFLDQGKLAKELLRVPLKDVEAQLRDHPDIFRCHRSYLINRQQISKITGNARAYSIHLIASDEKIPVSRGLKKDSFFD